MHNLAISTEHALRLGGVKGSFEELQQSACALDGEVGGYGVVARGDGIDGHVFNFGERPGA
jgi:hypothetical protein